MVRVGYLKSGGRYKVTYIPMNKVKVPTFDEMIEALNIDMSAHYEIDVSKE